MKDCVERVSDLPAGNPASSGLGTCRTTDVFVIGGGPAGLAAAIAARQRGFDVIVADGSVPPIDKACGEGIMPDGVAGALELGVRFETTGAHPLRGIRFRDGETCVEAPFPGGYGLGVRRTELHRIMADRASEAGVRLAWGARVTGITEEGVFAGGRLVCARWIVGADGGRSPVRRWAGLETFERDRRRFGFRRHYQVEPESEFVEIHWGQRCQLYITPAGTREICVVLTSRDPHLRLEEALPHFPEVARRLRSARPTTFERGAITVSRRLRSVCKGRVALVGDASGSVDSISGQGLCLLFRDAVALAGALEAGDLGLYRTAHRRIRNRPQFMEDLMLLLENHGRLRHRVMRVLASNPRLFARMLAMHVGQHSPFDFLTNGLALGWRMLSA